ncbi:MAG: carbonic anhydrase [Methylobacillus sp.]|jgi:carbonic anhydrase|nr:carbonic anhydrase [Methylobacillus sp.]
MRDVKKFVRGFRRFQHQYLENRHALFERLVEEGQRPRALVIACCDSRCDPALLTDCDPGDMFVVRNVANLVPPYTQAMSFAATSSAMAFAVRNLEVEHVIVMGHARCGGIRTLMANHPPTCAEEALITQWLDIAEEARLQVLKEMPDSPGDTQARACEQASVLISLENMLSYPWIRSRVEEGSLALHGWYFDMENGELLQYQAEADCFEVLVANNLETSRDSTLEQMIMPGI